MVRVPEKKTLVLVFLPAVSFIGGFLDYGLAGALTRTGAYTTVYAALFLALIFLWFWLDARGRQYHTSWGLRGSMIGLTIIALPYYLFRSRGFIGGAKALGLGGLVFVVTMMAYRVSAWISGASG